MAEIMKEQAERFDHRKYKTIRHHSEIAQSGRVMLADEDPRVKAIRDAQRYLDRLEIHDCIMLNGKHLAEIMAGYAADTFSRLEYMTTVAQDALKCTEPPKMIIPLHQPTDEEVSKFRMDLSAGTRGGTLGADAPHVVLAALENFVEGRRGCLIQKT